MLNKRTKYGDDWGVPSAEHPAGECLNRSAPGVEDGSYFEKSWVNDLMALSGALMTSAGYTPNGTEDTATACQVLDAMVNSKWSGFTNYELGTIVKGSDGNHYYCSKVNGPASSVSDPVSDSLDNWRQYPYKSVDNSNGHAKLWFDGRLDMKGEVLPSAGKWSATLPVSAVSLNIGDVFLSARANAGTSVLNYPVNVVDTASTTSISGGAATISGAVSGSFVHWQVIDARWV